MAHGGFHVNIHHHSSSARYGNPIVFGILILVIFIISLSGISEKKPLEGKYETYESYLIDKEEYFFNPNELISGLQYLHEQTNIQMIVMTSNESWSDSKAIEQYHSIFSDEAHILIIIPTSWFSSTEYYVIGDLANTVISDYEINSLLYIIDGSKNGTKWNKKLREFSDKLLAD